MGDNSRHSNNEQNLSGSPQQQQLQKQEMMPIAVKVPVEDLLNQASNFAIDEEMSNSLVAINKDKEFAKLRKRAQAKPSKTMTVSTAPAGVLIANANGTVYTQLPDDNDLPKQAITTQKYLQALAEKPDLDNANVTFESLNEFGLYAGKFDTNTNATGTTKVHNALSGMPTMVSKLWNDNKAEREAAVQNLLILQKALRAYARLAADQQALRDLQTKNAQAYAVVTGTAVYADLQHDADKIAVANFLAGVSQRSTDAYDEELQYVKPNVEKMSDSYTTFSDVINNALARSTLLTPVTLSDYQLTRAGAIDSMRKMKAEIDAYRKTLSESEGELSLNTLLTEAGATQFMASCEQLEASGYYGFGNRLQREKFNNPEADPMLTILERQQMLLLASRWEFLKEQVHNAKRRHRDLVQGAYVNEKRNAYKAEKNKSIGKRRVAGNALGFLFALTCGITMGGVFFMTPALQIPAFLVPFTGAMGAWIGQSAPFLKSKSARFLLALVLGAAFAAGTFFSGGLLPIIGAAVIGVCVFAANFMMSRHTIGSALSDWKMGIATTKTKLGERRNYTKWEKFLGVGVALLAIGGGLLNAGITFFGTGALVSIPAVMLAAAVFQGVPLAIMFGISLRSLIVDRKTLIADVSHFFLSMFMDEIIPAQKPTTKLPFSQRWKRKEPRAFTVGIVQAVLTAGFGALAVIGCAALTKLSVTQVNQLLAFTKQATVPLTFALCWVLGLGVELFFSLKALSKYMKAIFATDNEPAAEATQTRAAPARDILEEPSPAGETEKHKKMRLGLGWLNGTGNALPVFLSTSGLLRYLATPGAFAMSVAANGLAVPEKRKNLNDAADKRLKRLAYGPEQRRAVVAKLKMESLSKSLAVVDEQDHEAANLDNVEEAPASKIKAIDNQAATHHVTKLRTTSYLNMLKQSRVERGEHTTEPAMNRSATMARIFKRKSQ